MRHPIIDAFRLCNRIEQGPKGDATTWALAISIDRYFSSLFDHLATISDGKREVSIEQIIAICEHLGLPSPIKNRSNYGHDGFCDYLAKAMTLVAGGRHTDHKCEVRPLPLEEVIEQMIRKDECQWRMLEAVSKRSMITQLATGRPIPKKQKSIFGCQSTDNRLISHSLINDRSPISEQMSDINQRFSKPPVVDTQPKIRLARSVSKTRSGDHVSIQMREVQIENLMREVIQKQAKIEALERFSLALCEKLADIDSSNLASKIKRSHDSNEKRAKRRRADSKSKNRSIDRKRSRSRSILEEANKALNEKLVRITGDLTGVRSILTQVQPGVEKLEKVVEEKGKNMERKESVVGGQFEKCKISKGTPMCLHQSAMCDSVSDSGCMSDEDMAEEMTNSQTSESAIRVEAIVLNCLRQCTEGKVAAAQEPETGVVEKPNMDGMAMAKTVRQRLQEVSARLRDTEARLAHLTFASSSKRGEPDGGPKMLTATCAWQVE